MERGFLMLTLYMLMLTDGLFSRDVVKPDTLEGIYCSFFENAFKALLTCVKIYSLINRRAVFILLLYHLL